jgi:isopentenyl-diphosphate delta-isomerase
MLNEEFVVLVDEHDRAQGEMEKLQAHREGMLHRAVSVVVTDSAGRHVLQQRAAEKYHGARLWSNTCCGHPRPGESPADAAARRLREEMGLSCALRRVATFVYRAQVGELIEHEVDHVFTGISEVEPHPDPEEVMAWRATQPAELSRDLNDHPERYTPWLPLVLRAIRDSAVAGR